MRIRSNVKGDINLNLESPYVLVHGRNGGGKSAVVHSVELACFGEVRDAAGRTMNHHGHHDGQHRQAASVPHGEP